MNTKVQITQLNNNGDARGFSFMAPAEALAFVGRMADVHLASMKPGAVRGNHYHLRRREAIVVLPGASGLSIGTRATDRLLNIASLMAAAPCWC
jgi:dTDP-4-dehydrorhamnose 3,5-epimerase-like enzyme